MYLTKFNINKNRRDAQRLLSSPQIMHAAVMGSFPIDPTGEDGRVLYRIDSGQYNMTLLMSSPTKPDLTHLVEQAGWPASEEKWETRDYSPLFSTLSEGMKVRFKFTGNPTNTLPKKDIVEGIRTRGKRVAHVTIQQQLSWLKNKEALFGAEFETVNLTSHSIVDFSRKGQRVKLAIANFDGVLTINNPLAMEKVIRFGIGHGKSYGCGLITLAKL